MREVNQPLSSSEPSRFTLRNMRWWVIAPLLILSTTMNHLDRNVLAQAAPTLHSNLGIDEIQLSYIVVSFQIAYMIMHLGAGRIIDWLGTRAGFALSVCFWSIANMCHGFATGWRSMAFCRFTLGVGEGGNYPAAAKAVAEWFPPSERTVAMGILNFGAGFGGIAAPLLTSYLIIHHSWQAPFVVTGAIGFLWVALWLKFYRSPQTHPWARADEVAAIGAEREIVEEKESDKGEGVWTLVLKSRNVWALSIARFFTEQPWSFFVVWIPTYLSTQRGLNLKELGIYGWVPFVAADLGCLVGGYLSPLFGKMGFKLLTARKLGLTVPCVTMIFILFVFRAKTLSEALFYFCIGTFSHQALCATLLAMPADLMPKRAVATSLGLTGALGYFGVILSTLTIGRLAKAGFYGPIFWGLAFMDLFAAAVVWVMVHPDEKKNEEARG